MISIKNIENYIEQETYLTIRMDNGDFAQGKITMYESFKYNSDDGVLYLHARYKIEPDKWTSYDFYQITNSSIESVSILDGLPVELREQDIDTLNKYKEECPVKLVLSKIKDNFAILSEDEYLDFYEWLLDASVFTLDDEFEATDDTYAIERIIDYLYYMYG